MTTENKLKIHELRFNESITIGQVVIRKARGDFYTLTYDGIEEKYSASRASEIYAKIDEVNSKKKTKDQSDVEIGKQYLVDGTDLIAIKNIDGTYSLYENGEFLTGVKGSEYEKVIESYRKKKLAQKVNETKKQIKRDATMNSRKKILYFFILTFTVIITVAVFVLGVKFEGVSFTRKNQELYEVIYDLANERYPEKKFDKFDAVYYTLNYYAHKQNYFMLPIEIYDPAVDDTFVLPAIESYLYWQYKDPNGDGDYSDQLSMDLTNDHTYSGWEFNAMFRYDDGRYMEKEKIYAIIWGIMSQDLVQLEYAPDIDFEEMLTLSSVSAAYKVWDANDSKVNRAYNWEYVNADGYSIFDRNVDYYNSYLTRNGFIRLFINDSSKFINEYNLFETIGWLSWTNVALILLFIFLAIFIWLFDHSDDKKWKLSKGFIIFLGVLGLIIALPLGLQYLFEGLNKNATAFLDVVENTTFTTTTTVMNFIFDWIIKFANILFTGVVTIALPLKVVRYFTHKQINKVTKNVKITKIISPNTTITQDISDYDSSDFRI